MKNFTGRIFFPRVLLEGFFESFKGTFFSRDNFHNFYELNFFFLRRKKKKLGRVNSYSRIRGQYKIESE